MNDRLQAISTQGTGQGAPPDDGAVDRLSRQIAEIHEHLGGEHRARAEFDGAGGQYTSGPASPSAVPGYPPSDLRDNLGPSPMPHGFSVGLCEAYEDRGRARLAREEYHLALADFAAALMIHPASSVRDMSGRLWDGRYEAIRNLSEAFPKPEVVNGKPRHEATAPQWVVRSISAGHLVVGDFVILAHYPATPEGREAAVRAADRLAGDAEARSFFDNRYLTKSHKFDVLVYAFDGARLRLEHLAPFADKDDIATRPIDPFGEAE